MLAGLSLERTDDADRFIETFRGDDQLVAGYLTDELLAVLDEDERRRMVEAAVLHRLSGPLLDAVTGSDDGARWLDGLAARNQLVIRLDAVGEWYRYHHLFRDMLLLEARRSIPDRLPDLHRRAAAWFETSGYPAAAVDHLLAAGDREQAMYLMRFVGPDLLGSGQLRTLRNILERLSAGGELDAICSTLSGWDHYLTGHYEEAQRLLDRATATLPADIDPMRTMPLRINLALGTGDVATALAGAREVIAAGEVEARPSELTTATGAAFAWAGLPEEARAALAIALVRTQAEKRVTAHAMALVAAAVVEFHSAGDEAACAAAQRALDFATSSGLGEYHGIAPAVAIRAATCPPDATATADAEHAVVLARRATTMLGLAFVLTLAGDVLLRDGADRGRELLDEAHEMIETVPRSRHHPSAAGASGRPAPGRPITARPDGRAGGATVRAGDGRAPLPAVHTLAPRDRTRALRVAEHREDAVQGHLPQARGHQPPGRRAGRPRAPTALRASGRCHQWFGKHGRGVDELIDDSGSGVEVEDGSGTGRRAGCRRSPLGVSRPASRVIADRSPGDPPRGGNVLRLLPTLGVIGERARNSLRPVRPGARRSLLRS